MMPEKKKTTMWTRPAPAAAVEEAKALPQAQAATVEPLKPLAPVKARITVTGSVYHQAAGEQPVAFTGGFSRRLESQEQPYVRKIKVSEEWQLLDYGWVPAPGLLVLRNDEGKFTQVIPTDEQRAEAAAKVVEVVVVRPGADAAAFAADWLIPPGEDMRGTPSGAAMVYVRCQRGVASCTVFLVPN